MLNRNIPTIKDTTEPEAPVQEATQEDQAANIERKRANIQRAQDILSGSGVLSRDWHGDPASDFYADEMRKALTDRSTLKELKDLYGDRLASLLSYETDILAEQRAIEMGTDEAGEAFKAHTDELSDEGFFWKKAIKTLGLTDASTIAEFKSALAERGEALDKQTTELQQ